MELTKEADVEIVEKSTKKTPDKVITVGMDMINSWIVLDSGAPYLVLNIAKLIMWYAQGKIGDDLYEELIAPLILPDNPTAQRYGVDPKFVSYYVRAIAAGVSEKYIRTYERYAKKEQDAIFRAYAEQKYPEDLICALTLRHRGCLDACLEMIDALLAAGYDAGVLSDWLDDGVTVGSMKKHLLKDGDEILSADVRDERLGRLEKQASRNDFRKVDYGAVASSREVIDREFAGKSKDIRKRAEKFLETGYSLEIVKEIVERKMSSTGAQVLAKLRSAGVSDEAVDLMLLYIKTDKEFANRAVAYADWVAVAHMVDLAAGRDPTREDTLVRVMLQDKDGEAVPPVGMRMRLNKLGLLDEILSPAIPRMCLLDNELRKRGYIKEPLENRFRAADFRLQ